MYQKALRVSYNSATQFYIAVFKKESGKVASKDRRTDHLILTATMCAPFTRCQAWF